MDKKIYYPNLENSKTFKIDENKYNEMYEESISSPEKFWGRMGNRIDCTIMCLLIGMKMEH